MLNHRSDEQLDLYLTKYYKAKKSQLENQNTNSEEEIDEATELLLTSKENYLKSKRYTTLEEDLELELLNNPTTRLHATRIAELAFKEDKTDFEKYELSLYENVETRPYAYRITELQSQPNLTPREKNELNWLISPVNRPFTKKYLAILNKVYYEDLTSIEKRELQLFKNPTTVKNSVKIAELESLELLSDSQQEDLSIAYIMKLANISPYSNTDFQINFRSRALNPTQDCILRDSNYETYNIEVAKVRAIQDAFNQAATKLMESYQRQIFNPSRIQAVLNKVSMFQPNDNVKNIFERRKDALSLTLQKLFFDNNLPFSEKSLQLITDYLNDLVQNKKLSFQTDDYKSLQKQIVPLIEKMTLPTPEQNHSSVGLKR